MGALRREGKVMMESGCRFNVKTETISEALGLAKQSTRTYLQKLTEIGLIEAHGANKNCTYSLSDIFEEGTAVIGKQ